MQMLSGLVQGANRQNLPFLRQAYPLHAVCFAIARCFTNATNTRMSMFKASLLQFVIEAYVRHIEYHKEVSRVPPPLFPVFVSSCVLLLVVFCRFLGTDDMGMLPPSPGRTIQPVCTEDGHVVLVDGVHTIHTLPFDQKSSWSSDSMAAAVDVFNEKAERTLAVPIFLGFWNERRWMLLPLSESLFFMPSISVGTQLK